jgi:hypothetical protein
MGNTCTIESNELGDIGGNFNSAPVGNGGFARTQIEHDPTCANKDPFDFKEEVNLQAGMTKRPTVNPEAVGGAQLYSYEDSIYGQQNRNGDEPVDPVAPGAAVAFAPLVVQRMGELGDPMYQGNDPAYMYNGHSYQGAYSGGIREGVGLEVTPTGDMYNGQWHRDMKHGNGRMILANGDYYEGEFRENKATGNGIFWRGFGNEKITYTGEFRNGMQDGKGVEVYPGGASYKGDFVQNVKHGEGEFLFPDKTRYKGQFQNDKANGKGE